MFIEHLKDLLQQKEREEGDTENDIALSLLFTAQHIKERGIFILIRLRKEC